MKIPKKVVSMCFLALLLIPTVVAFSFLEKVTGFLSLDQILKTRTFAVPKLYQECRISIDGVCYEKVLPRDLEKQEQAKLIRLKADQKKIVDGKRVSLTPLSKFRTKNVKLGQRTFKKSLPVVLVCIERLCKEYSIDETVMIEGARYSLALVGDSSLLIPQDLPSTPHDEEIAVPAEEDFAPFEGLAAQPHPFKVGFVVDRSDNPDVTEEDLLDALEVANAKLTARGVPVRFILHDMVDLAPGLDLTPEATPSESIIDDYYLSHSADPPNGVVILRTDNWSRLFGGYRALSTNLAILGFTNSFYSPLYGDAFIYGSVQHLNHIYGACGYETDGSYVSNVSIARSNGAVECNNQIGIPCIYYNDAWRCSTINFTTNEYVQPYGFFANTVIHEFLHSFHPTDEETTYFHYCGNECPLSELSAVGLSCGVQGSMLYSGMCPVVWEEFKRSWNLCPEQPAYGDTLGRPCRQNCDCNQDEMCKLNLFSGKVCSVSQCNPYWNDCENVACNDDGVCLYQVTAVASQQLQRKESQPILRRILTIFR